MVSFTACIHQFEEQGEKTGWMYIEIPADIAEKLNPGSKRSFRVKGKLDQFAIEGVAVMPMGGGRFIMPFNAAMRQGTKKKKGAMLKVQLSADKQELALPAGFLECLNDEPEAKAFFNEMKLSHRNYFIKWITGVKSDESRDRRIAQVVTALSRKQGFVDMIRSQKAERGS